MELEAILEVLQQYGYAGLFIWLWVGVIGIPIPNEMILLSIGYASSLKLFHSQYLFIITYLGLLAASTTSYTVGRFAGHSVLKFFQSKKRLNMHIEKSLTMIKRYHIFALFLSYFIPGLRSMVPFIFGMSRLAFYKFALISYGTTLLWTTIYFLIGVQLGDQIRVNSIGLKISFFVILAIVGSVGIAILLSMLLRNKRKVRLFP